MCNYFGIAKEIITPNFKTTLSCTGTFDVVFNEIHDDVFVRAAIFDDANSKVIVISYDLLFHSPDLNYYIKQYVKERYNVDSSNVVITHTHNHNSPSTFGYNDDESYKEYEDFLRERTKACIDKAFLSMFEGTIQYGTTTGDWNVNRRREVNGKMMLAPNHEGNKDNELIILKIIDTRGRIRGLIVNYACHPVHYPEGLAICSEYPGRVCQLLESEYYGVTSLFIQGAGANSRPKLTAKNGKFLPCRYDELDEMAHAMVKKVGDWLLYGEQKVISMKLSASEFELKLKLNVQPREYFEKAMLNKDLKGPNKKNAVKVCANYDEQPDYAILRCSLVKLADWLYISSMGGEPCFEIKQLVQEALAGQNLIFAGYSDATAYIVSDAMIREGGYEVECFLEYGLKGPFLPQVDDVIREGFKNNAKLL